jgi:hypothetical protein
MNLNNLLKTIVVAAAFVPAVLGTTSVSFASTMSVADQYLCSNAIGGGVDVDIRQFCPKSEWLRH